MPRIATLLLLAGILLIAKGALIIMVSSQPTLETRASWAAVIIIGPIPFVFGSGPDVGRLLALAIALFIAAMLMFTVSLRRL